MLNLVLLLLRCNKKWAVRQWHQPSQLKRLSIGTMQWWDNVFLSLWPQFLISSCHFCSALSTLSFSSVLICHSSLILLHLLLLFFLSLSLLPSPPSVFLSLSLLPGIARPTLSQSEVCHCACGSFKAARCKVEIRPKQGDGMMVCTPLLLWLCFSMAQPFSDFF